MGWVEREREESNARNTFGLDTRTILANKTLNEIPFNIVWLMFFSVPFRLLFVGGLLWIFHYEFIRIRRRRKNPWKAISHVHTGKKRHTYEYIQYTYSTEEKKHKFIWSSLQTVFFYLFCFCCVCVPATSVFIVFRFRGIFHLLLSYGPRFSLFAGFLFFSLFCVYVTLVFYRYLNMPHRIRNE